MTIEIIKGHDNEVADFFSSPSRTPETDASCGYALSSHYGRLEGSYLQMDRNGPFVHAEVARKLERERDEARMDRANGDIATMTINHYERILRERDEARESLKHIEEYGTKEINAAVELRQKLAEALVELDNMQDQRDLAMKVIKRIEQERNEAREERDKLQIMRNEVVAANKGAKMNALVSNSLAGKLNQAERERDEAREFLKHIGEYGTEEINAAIDLRQKLASALVECDTAQKELSSIHRWIERNHADGFIDSLTYLQNLERVTDYWYERIDAIETDARRFVRERDEARAVAGAMADIAFKHLTSLLASTPHSKDAAHDEETQQVIAAIKQWKELKQ